MMIKTEPAFDDYQHLQNEHARARDAVSHADVPSTDGECEAPTKLLVVHGTQSASSSCVNQIWRTCDTIQSAQLNTSLHRVHILGAVAFLP